MHSFGSIVPPSSRLAQSVFVGGEKRQSRSLGLSGISRSASVHRVMHTGCNVFDDTRSTSFYARIIVRPSPSLSLSRSLSAISFIYELSASPPSSPRFCDPLFLFGIDLPWDSRTPIHRNSPLLLRGERENCLWVSALRVSCCSRGNKFLPSPSPILSVNV